MGFWSKLAKIGSIAGAGVATAMTGGAASPWLIGAIGAGGAGLGAASEAMTKNRENKANYNLNKDQFDLLAEQRHEAAQDRAYKQARRAAYAKKFQPTAPPPGVVDAFANYQRSPEQLAADDEMYRQAMKQLLTGKPHEMTPLEKAGFWEQFLGAAGMGAQAYGQLAAAQNGERPVNYGGLLGDRGDY